MFDAILARRAAGATPTRNDVQSPSYRGCGLAGAGPGRRAGPGAATAAGDLHGHQRRRPAPRPGGLGEPLARDRRRRRLRRGRRAASRRAVDRRQASADPRRRLSGASRPAGRLGQPQRPVRTADHRGGRLPDVLGRRRVDRRGERGKQHPVLAARSRPGVLQRPQDRDLPAATRPLRGHDHWGRRSGVGPHGFARRAQKIAP